MRNDDKRQLRRMKRDLKRDGRRQHRRDLKHQLDTDPESAKDWEGSVEYDRRTAKPNGPYKDTKRRRMDKQAADNRAPEAVDG